MNWFNRLARFSTCTQLKNKTKNPHLSKRLTCFWDFKCVPGSSNENA